MIQKQSFNVIKGMRQDISPSKANPEYIFDARNIRLTARGDDTLLSITNEQGSKNIYAPDSTPQHSVDLIKGKVLGYCILNNYLVTFSTDNTYSGGTIDYITRVYMINNTWYSDILYSSHSYVQNENGGQEFKEVSGRLNFGDTIQTLGVYENENIQKVYWVDGVNQPRVINITKDYLENKTVEEIAASYTNTSFDFVPELQLNETIDVRTVLGGNGRFSAGTIQYAFTYYNKYGQESNIFYTTDLYYITHSDRGGSPEDLINTSFKISIKDVDYQHFDYIRIYSIHRTSIDAVPEVKKVIELPTASQELPSESLTKTSEAFYIKVKMSSTIEVNGKPLSDYQDYIQYTEFEHGFYNGNYYVFTRNEFSNLTIKVEDKIIKHGTDTAIYIAVDSSSYPPPEGRLIAADEAETSKMSIYSSKIIGNEDIVFVDTNTTGESVDPTFLLYVGGEDIIANTLNQKDNTLFLGNITLTKPSIPSSIKTLLQPTYDETNKEWSNKIITVNQNTRSIQTDGQIGSHYVYSNQLVDGNSTTFKIGEHYRLGLQFQYKNGKWSEPLPINYAYTVTPKDATTNKDCRPNTGINGDNIEYNLPYLYISLPIDIQQTLIDFGFKRTRAVIVNPALQDRKVILQGMVCPTVYTNYNRNSDKQGDIYAQSSWFFRPFHGGSNDKEEYKQINAGGYLAYSHGLPINGIKQSFGKLSAGENLTNITATEIEYIGDNSTTDEAKNFRVDQTFLNLYSPDIEFDTSIQSLDSQKFTFKKVGRVDFDASVGDISIQTSSPPIGERVKGFDHKTTAFIRSTGGTNVSAKSLISNFFYIDDIVDEIRGENRFEPVTGYGATKFLVCPWQSSGSLNNDINRPTNSGTRSAVLKRKVISNLKVSFNNTWKNTSSTDIYSDTQIGVFNSDEVTLLKYKGKNYLGNVDTLLTYENEYSKIVTGVIINGKSTTTTVNSALDFIGDEYADLERYIPSIRMKYKTAPHIVFQLSDKLTSDTGSIPPHLYLMDICRDTVANAFGGTSDAALKANLWIPSGLSVKLDSTKATTVNFLHGDCWYQRYDCLKTYPFTQEDENSIVEIGSFMVETRVNIDGRYDRNRGLLSNLNITPQNFNLLNNIYSQKDNFFNYRVLDKDLYKLNTFSNTITWSKEKMSSEETDTWTNITMTNTFDMDGNLGQIQSIENYNNELYCFQDKGVSKILFNNRVQIPTGDNIPIEISNGYKVQGKVYLSNTVGCQNQKAIKVTPNGIYFSDLYNSGIYLLNQQGMQDISTPRGFTNWVKECQPDRLYYDTNNGDLYLIGNGYIKDTYRNCLCFSEKLNEFTSFMDYYNNKYMFNIQNNFYAVEDYTAYHYSGTYFMQMFSGDYMKDYHITYIANQNPTNDKIFNTLEFRADSLQDNNKLIEDSSTPKSPNICPFNKVTVWNEYQEGTENLSKVYGKPSALKEKFRTWRINIPRDNVNKRDRIRNPWAYIKLEGYNNTNRMQLHDMQVWYYDNDIWKYQQK